MKQFVLHGNIPAKKNSKEIRIIYKKTSKGPKPIPQVRSSERYMNWHDMALQELMIQKRGYSTDRAKLIFSFYWGDYIRRDSDNGVSSIFDTLVDAGILTDDNWKVAYRYVVNNDYDKSNPRCEIQIYEPDEIVQIDF